MKRFFLLGALAPALFAEISAFDAGNVELDNPYGLTASEKAVLKNKQHLEGLSKEYAGVDFKTRKALERIDGLQSLVDDLGLKQQNFNTRLSDFESVASEAQKTHESELARLKSLIAANSAEIAKLKKAIAELADALEPSSAKNSPSASNQLSPAARQKAALRMLANGNYSAAAAEFEALIALNYKPAGNNFNLAECAFFDGDYQRAIYHYKASSDSYRHQGVQPANEPVLLLHTAQSLERIGQGAKAKAFYDALKAKYPASAEVKSINKE